MVTPGQSNARDQQWRVLAGACGPFRPTAQFMDNTGSILKTEEKPGFFEFKACLRDFLGV